MRPRTNPTPTPTFLRCPARRRPSCRPRLEALEERAVPSTLEIDWMRTSERGISAVALGGDVYVTGSLNGGYPGQADGFVARYSRSGALLWVTPFGTADADYPSGIAVDASGVYVAGTIRRESYPPIPMDVPVADAFVSRLSLDGTLLGTTRIATERNDAAYGIALSDGGVYAVGYTEGTFPGQTHSAGSEDAFVARLDRSGNLLGVTQFGNTFYAEANGVAVAGDTVYVSGVAGDSFPGQPPGGGGFVARLDLGGRLLGITQFVLEGGTSARGLAVSGGTVYVVGDTRGTFPGQVNAGDLDAFVARLDLSGGLLGATQFGTPNYDDISGIAADGSGVYVLGRTLGAFPGQTNAGNYDIYVAHLGLGGDVLDVTQFGTEEGDFTAGIAVGDAGVYVTGSTRGTFPGQPVFNVPYEVGNFVAHLIPERPPLPDGGPDYAAVFAPEGGYGRWYLRRGGDPNAPVTSFPFGLAGWKPVAGDWDGDGTDTPGVYDPATATWYLRQGNAPADTGVTGFAYGYSAWTPVAGDWDRDGVTTAGVVDATGAASPYAVWYLRNGTGPGAADVIFAFGVPGWVPVAGDWDGNGTVTAGMFDPSTGTWYLRLSNDPADGAVASFRYGGWVDWKPVAGDWDGDGIDSVGVVDPAGMWYLRNSSTPGDPDIEPFAYGLPGWTPLAGAWGVPGPPPAAGEVSGGAQPLRQANLDASVGTALARLEGTESALLAAPAAGNDEAATLPADWQAPTLQEEDSDTVTDDDLLSAVLHEMGHLTGLGHDTDGLMADRLAPGVRPLAAIDTVFARGLF